MAIINWTLFRCPYISEEMSCDQDGVYKIAVKCEIIDVSTSLRHA